MDDNELIRLERRFANDPDGRKVVAEVWRLRQVVGRIAAGVMDPQAVAAEAWEACKVKDAPNACMRCKGPKERADWWGCNACVNRDRQEGLCRRD